MDDCGLTQLELGKRVGKARSSVTNHLRALDLPMRIQHMLREGLLGLGHAKAWQACRGATRCTNKWRWRRRPWRRGKRAGTRVLGESAEGAGTASTKAQSSACP